MLQIFQPSYWFTIEPAAVGGITGNIIFAFFVLVFVLGIVARAKALQKEDRYLKAAGMRIAVLLITMGLIGVALFFFSFERIQLFGSRFWYLIWLIATIWWAVYIFRYIKREIPEQKKRARARKERNKYMPQKKKKK